MSSCVKYQSYNNNTNFFENNKYPKHLPGNRIPDIFKDKYLKNQIFSFKSSACIEKPNFKNLDSYKELFDINTIKDIDANPFLKKNSINNYYNNSTIKSPNKGNAFSSLYNFSSIKNITKCSDSNNNNDKFKDCQNLLKSNCINNSYPKILPQWIKYDKKVLKFKAYYNEHITESRVENYRTRECFILFYLEDETIQVYELKVENSGMPQGTIIKRQKIEKISTKELKSNSLDFSNKHKSFIGIEDFKIGSNITLYGKTFKICDCDEFTKNFYKEKKIELNTEKAQTIPVIKDENYEAFKNIDNSEHLKNFAEYKEFCEINLGGGHPNRGLKNFLYNNRKVLSFDIVWDDIHQDKETKNYKLNYYLADNMLEIREIKVNNSGRSNFPYLLKKSKLPKKLNFVYCPGLNKENDNNYYKPEDMIIGNSINVFNRDCLIVDCDNFTKEWFKKNLNITQKSIKTEKNQHKAVAYEIPPHNGFGSEEDSILTCFCLRPEIAIKNIVEAFKKDKFILRFKAKLTTHSEIDYDRNFVFSFYPSDSTLKIYEEASKNSGRISSKFMERRKVKNNLTNEYYVEKDFFVGAYIYISKYIFKLIECDDFTKKYMIDNCDCFKDSDIYKVINRIRLEKNNFNSYDEFLVDLLTKIDEKDEKYVSFDQILNGLKRYNLYLSKQEAVTLEDFIHSIKDSRGLVSVKGFYEIIRLL